MLYIVADLDDLTNDLMTEIDMGMTRESGRGNAQVAIHIDQVQITPTDTRETVSYPHPSCARKGLTRDILNT
ncbi:MAG: hypothetical protein NVS4B11_12960 [Ktedonobacteraceae bacterium]